MSDKRYEANIIRATAVEPANNLETTSAPGVWSIDEVVELQKKNKWPTAGNAIVNVEELFSTFLYDGTGVKKVINNDIALGNSNAGSSVEFAGGADTRKQSLSYANNSNYVVGSSNNFTIEFFVYLQATNDNLAFGLLSGYNAYLTGIYITSGNLSGYFQTGASAQTQVATGQTLVVGQFYHIALVRNGTAFAVYLDGTSVGTATSSSNIHDASQFLSIGNYSNSDTDTLNGFVSNFRYSSTARYTGNFTPTTSNFTSDSDTILLSCQGQTADLSSNSIAVTEGGSSPKLHSNFGPFTGTSGQGGLVWTKQRDDVRDHQLYDTVRGADSALESSDTIAPHVGGAGVVAFNAGGFSLGTGSRANANGTTYCSWTWRKAPKFFDIVQYTGNSTNRTIAHSLNQVPGMIIVKNITTAGYSWQVYHRSLANTERIELDGTGAKTTGATTYWNSTTATSSVFSIGTHDQVNKTGDNYIAYVFSHNNNDGGFGPDQDEDIIKCGSFTSDGTDTITLGFEPQWLMVKQTDGSAGWYMWDIMRGWQNGDVGNENDPYLYANSSAAEAEFTVDVGFPTATGFETKSFGTGDYIYMAIRRPQATPTTASNVFALTTRSSGNTVKLGFVPDFWIGGNRGGTGGTASQFVMDRPRGDFYLGTSSTAAEIGTNDPFSGATTNTFKNNSTGGTRIEWLWRRARGYFDIVAFTGNGGGSRNITHNLGSAPGMLWLKRRDGSSPYGHWYVQHTGIAATNYLKLNENSSETGSPDSWDSTYASADVFRVGPDNNVNTYEYIVYLFGSLSGISKIGSYTGSSSGVVTVDCGFTSGARFVLIKRSDSGGSGDWYVYDSLRGINSSADDPYLLLDTDDAEVTNTNNIEPHSSGFQLTQQGANPVSINGGTYVFYAIA